MESSSFSLKTSPGHRRGLNAGSFTQQTTVAGTPLTSVRVKIPYHRILHGQNALHPPTQRNIVTPQLEGQSVAQVCDYLTKVSEFLDGLEHDLLLINRNKQLTSQNKVLIVRHTFRLYGAVQTNMINAVSSSRATLQTIEQCTRLYLLRIIESIEEQDRRIALMRPVNVRQVPVTCILNAVPSIPNVEELDNNLCTRLASEAYYQASAGCYYTTFSPAMLGYEGQGNEVVGQETQHEVTRPGWFSRVRTRLRAILFSRQ